MIKKIVISLINFYIKKISPMTPPRCKYIPTCSRYAIDSIERNGLIKGGIKAFYRIFRCNPLSKGGYDPVK